MPFVAHVVVDHVIRTMAREDFIWVERPRDEALWRDEGVECRGELYDCVIDWRERVVNDFSGASASANFEVLLEFSLEPEPDELLVERVGCVGAEGDGACALVIERERLEPIGPRGPDFVVPVFYEVSHSVDGDDREEEERARRADEKQEAVICKHGCLSWEAESTCSRGSVERVTAAVERDYSDSASSSGAESSVSEGRVAPSQSQERLLEPPEPMHRTAVPSSVT